MIKNRAKILLVGFIWPLYFLLAALQAIFFSAWLEVFNWRALSLGLVVFGLSFSGLEMLLRKVLLQQSLKGGIRSGIFWLVVKFLGPLSIIYIAVDRGFSVLFLVSGISLGLLSVTVILVARELISREKTLRVLS